MAGFSGILRSDLNWSRADLNTLDLSKLRVAIVGGTGGIGRALALVLASRGASVVVVGQTFRDDGVRGLTFMKADLSLMVEARRVGRDLSADLDLVVMTTGIITAPKREQTAEGVERDLAISYLSRLAIVRELAPRLGQGRPATAQRPRVFIMGFPGTEQKAAVDDLNAEKKYDAMPQHMNTVAGNEALVLDAAARYPNVGFFGLNPGLIKTNIRSNMLGGEGSLKHRFVEFFIGLLMISAEKYAERVTPLLVSPDLEGRSPAMFNQKALAILASKVMTPSHVADTIAASDALLARAVSSQKPSAP